MKGSEFLSQVANKAKPEPNIFGDFDCMVCREAVLEAFWDAVSNVLTWECSQGHVSGIKDFM